MTAKPREHWREESRELFTDERLAAGRGVRRRNAGGVESVNLYPRSDIIAPGASLAFSQDTAVSLIADTCKVEELS